MQGGVSAEPEFPLEITVRGQQGPPPDGLTEELQKCNLTLDSWLQSAERDAVGEGWTTRRPGGLAMNIDAALVREQGVNFAVVVVKKSALHNLGQRDQLIATYSRRYFGGVPVVLMGQDAKGEPEYYGRQDLVKWLSNVLIEALPWKRYSAA